MQHDIQPAIIAAIITPIAPALKRLFDDDIEDDDDELKGVVYTPMFGSQ
jgi:hypothetical protein